MPNHRKPVELHVLNGSYKENPSRRPKGAFKTPEVLRDAPKYFDADETAAWEELRVMAAIYVTFVDSWIAELACQLMARLRRREASASDIGKLLNCVGVMGMTPADRSRVTVHDKPPEGTFREFAA